MVLNRDGLVWAGRRIAEENSEYDGSPQLWQMPQGGIERARIRSGGAARALRGDRHALGHAAGRERRAGSTTTCRRTGRHRLKGRYRGQTQKWFAFRFDGDDSEIRIDPPPGGHAAEFDQWAWRPMAELPELIVPFKRQV